MSQGPQRHPQSWRPLVDLATAHAQGEWLRELDGILERQQNFWMRESCDVENFRLGVRARFRLLKLSRECQRTEALILSLRQQCVYRKMAVSHAEAAVESMTGYLDATATFSNETEEAVAETAGRMRLARARAFEEFTATRAAAVVRSPTLYWMDKWLRTEQEQLLLRLEIAALTERERCLQQILRKGQSWLLQALSLGRFHDAGGVPRESPFLSSRRAVS